MTDTRRSIASARIDGISWPGLPVADGDAVPDLLDDLQVHRAGVRLRYCEYSVHINIHSVHNLAAQCKHLWKRASGLAPARHPRRSRGCPLRGSRQATNACAPIGKVDDARATTERDQDVGST